MSVPTTDHTPGRDEPSTEGRAGLARHSEFLPIEPICLGEPVTPLVEIEWGGVSLLAKLEGALPTGSFKDRGSAVLVATLRARGVKRVICDSSGNAGASLAAYCARAGIACEIYAPATASSTKLVQARAYGAKLHLVEGSRADTSAAAQEAATRTTDAYHASHLREHAFVLGTQTFLLELYDQLGGVPPSAIVVPVGGATLLLGIHYSLLELRRRGRVPRAPALYGVQTDRCDPLVRAFEAGSSTIEPAGSPGPSLAEGILIQDPPHASAAVRAVQAWGGALLSVTETQIADATLELSRRGVFAEPTSAVAAAGTLELMASRPSLHDGPVVLAITGNGLKTSPTIDSLLNLR